MPLVSSGFLPPNPVQSSSDDRLRSGYRPATRLLFLLNLALASSRASENAYPATRLYSSCPSALIAAEYRLPVRFSLCVLAFPWRQKKYSATISRTLGKIERTVRYKLINREAVEAMSETAKRCNAPLALLPCDLLRFIPGYGSALRVTLGFRIKSLKI